MILADFLLPGPETLLVRMNNHAGAPHSPSRDVSPPVVVISDVFNFETKKKI